jgi:hypothetical protein
MNAFQPLGIPTIKRGDIDRAIGEDQTAARLFDGGPEVGLVDAAMGTMRAFDRLTAPGFESVNILRLAPDRFGIIGSNQNGIPTSFALNFKEPTSIETLHDVLTYGVSLDDHAGVEVLHFDVCDPENYRSNIEEINQIRGITNQEEAVILDQVAERATAMRDIIHDRAVEVMSLRGVEDPFSTKPDHTAKLSLDDLRFLGGASPFLADQVGCTQSDLDRPTSMNRIKAYQDFLETGDAQAYMESASVMHEAALESIREAMGHNTEELESERSNFQAALV